MKKICLLTTGIVALFLVVGSTNAFAGLSGIIAQGEFSVYKKGKLADKISGTTPVTEDALLVCAGKCLIKTKGIALVIQDGTEMSVKKSADQFNMMVMNGLVDFSLTEQAGKVAFYTADGQYTVGNPMFNASTANAIRGYMQTADDGRARVGLHDGRMVFSTGEGPRTVNSNEYILLKAEPKVKPSTTDAAATEVGAGAGACGWCWLGFSKTATIYSGCAVFAATTVTTVSKTKGSKGPNPYKKGSKNKGSNKKGSKATTTVTQTTTTGTTGVTATRVTTTRGTTTTTTSSKGSKGKKGSKGYTTYTRTTQTTHFLRPLPPPPAWPPCPTCPPPIVRRPLTPPPCPTCPPPIVRPPCCPPPSPSI